MSAQPSYTDFLAAKAALDPMTGIAEPSGLPSSLADFQGAIVPWALRRGRAALFAGTGLGKTLMEIAWADAVARHLNRPVLLLTPLAVAPQFVREADKFGLEVRRAASADDIGGAGVYVTNYDKLDRFEIDAFGGVGLDESSILKAFDGKTRNALIERCAQVPFRLAASATPAPNDFMELGNHAEFLGVMTHAEMLATFFIHDGGDTSKWRLKRHAERDFWRWVASWAVMLNSPADLGFSDEGYVLPPLRTHQVTVASPFAADSARGMLFPLEARTMQERLAARRASIGARVEAGAALAVAHDRPCVAWCNLNDESSALARAIPGAIEVRGSDPEGRKEEVLADFAEGRLRVLVTKPSICGFGMNWQHCHDTVFVGLNDSFEQLYQALRRFWRFGQMSAVDAHLIAAQAEGAVVANLRRKEAQAATMMAAMVDAMAGFSDVHARPLARERAPYHPRAVAAPSFLVAA
ncbi:hypothetical protein DFR49_3381 [Hephaestia caeni]|uniref:Helicase ATP-binding domain-containing protein n=1 Tax=Hephaestia caeni TaxID=645617 RepID=A0A397NIY4_9SPHN|nr:DEAD/DEAH box helicase [Hephaestia caeni]RIA37496.1 hypothetical protein DFR49_3381 [Hephaestia caeni]